jgi:ABC-2 type transport system ATP-binding protein
VRHRILLAAALFENPDLVLPERLFSGLDFGSITILRDLIKNLATRGKTVLVSSHEDGHD